LAFAKIGAEVAELKLSVHFRLYFLYVSSA
jgi:hypothetical protein